MHSGAATAVLVVLLILFAMFRRLRRLIGRQKLSVGRLWFRIALFAVIGAVVLVSSVVHPLALLASVVGLLVGAVLGWLGLRMTSFEQRPDGVYFKPNPYIGFAVFALFLLRLVYRFVEVAPMIRSASAAHPSGSLDAYNPYGYEQFTTNPLTAAIILVLFGYYVFYYAGLLWRNRELGRATA